MDCGNEFPKTLWGTRGCRELLMLQFSVFSHMYTAILQSGTGSCVAQRKLAAARSLVKRALMNYGIFVLIILNSGKTTRIDDSSICCIEGSGDGIRAVLVHHRNHPPKQRGIVEHEKRISFALNNGLCWISDPRDSPENVPRR